VTNQDDMSIRPFQPISAAKINAIVNESLRSRRGNLGASGMQLHDLDVQDNSQPPPPMFVEIGEDLDSYALEKKYRELEWNSDNEGENHWLTAEFDYTDAVEPQGAVWLKGERVVAAFDASSHRYAPVPGVRKHFAKLLEVLPYCGQARAEIYRFCEVARRFEATGLVVRVRVWDELADRVDSLPAGARITVFHHPQSRLWFVTNSQRTAIRRFMLMCNLERGGKAWAAMRVFSGTRHTLADFCPTTTSTTTTGDPGTTTTTAAPTTTEPPNEFYRTTTTAACDENCSCTGTTEDINGDGHWEADCAKRFEVSDSNNVVCAGGTRRLSVGWAVWMPDSGMWEVLSVECDPLNGTTTTPQPTTTTLYPIRIEPCSGRCKYVWSASGGYWVKDSDTCSPTTTTTTTAPSTTTTTGDPGSTTTSDPGSTTTTADPCECPTTTEDPSSTTTTTAAPPPTTTTTTEAPCQCVYPDFCGTTDGECTYTDCAGGYGAPTVSCVPSTTTTTPPSTTIDPSCNPTCGGDCDWVWAPTSGGWGWKLHSPCVGTDCGCAPPDPPSPNNFCGTAQTPCVVARTTPPPGDPGCKGACLYWWIPALSDWVRAPHVDPTANCVSEELEPFSKCGCVKPSGVGDVCAPKATPCRDKTAATFTSSTEPACPTSSSTTTSTTSECGYGCMYKAAETSPGVFYWDLESNSCTSGCTCRQPAVSPSELCERERTPCFPTSSTTTLPPTTTTTLPPTTTTELPSTTTTTEACGTCEHTFNGASYVGQTASSCGGSCGCPNISNLCIPCGSDVFAMTVDCVDGSYPTPCDSGSCPPGYTCGHRELCSTTTTAAPTTTTEESTTTAAPTTTTAPTTTAAPTTTTTTEDPTTTVPPTTTTAPTTEAPTTETPTTTTTVGPTTTTAAPTTTTEEPSTTTTESPPCYESLCVWECAGGILTQTQACPNGCDCLHAATCDFGDQIFTYSCSETTTEEPTTTAAPTTTTTTAAPSTTTTIDCSASSCEMTCVDNGNEDGLGTWTLTQDCPSGCDCNVAAFNDPPLGSVCTLAGAATHSQPCGTTEEPA